jgi:glycosyltransferase involved in cell wall biosynthesis
LLLSESIRPILKIVVNTRLLRSGQLDGIGWVTYNTLKYITQAHPEIEFHFLFDSGIEKEFIFSDNVKAVNLFPPAKHALLNIIWFEWTVKNYLNKIQPDLFFSPDGILCLGWKGKQVALIHDINFVHIPQDLKWSNRKYYNYFFPKYAKRANRLITISNYSKQDIVSTFEVDPAKIDVIQLGINSFFKPSAAEEIKITRQRYSQNEDYFLFVGTLHPRKNIIRLMEAFELFKEQNPCNTKLLISGKEMYKTKEMHTLRQSMKYKDDVIFTGRLNNSDLQQVYGAALALCFVPYFEGFGLPPIEAMQCDIPVICSNVTSMPEVVNDAALLVDPYNVDEIRDAMMQIKNDSSLRNELVRKGRIRKEQFSWNKTADQVWESLQKVLKYPYNGDYRI